MSFEEFKRMTYHTYKSIRIPGSNTVIDKAELMAKGRFDQTKADPVLRRVYEQEKYANRWVYLQELEEA